MVLLALASCGLKGDSMKATDFFSPQMVTLLEDIAQGNQGDAQQKLAGGLDLNSRGQEGITPLFWLMMEKDKDAVKRALQLGADPNYPSGTGNTPVAAVAGGNDDALLALLLDQGGDPNSVNQKGEPALFEAIGEERWSQVQMLLDHGADLDKLDNLHRNSALYAATLNKYEIAYKLVELGADYRLRSTVDDDIAWNIHEGLSQGLLNPAYPAYGWAQKLKTLLMEKGVQFPPLSPREVRIKEGRPNRWDLKAQAKEKQH